MLRGKANSANGYLFYWLGSASSTNFVWGLSGDFGGLHGNYFGGFESGGGYSGVRPVITVLKSKIS